MKHLQSINNELQSEIGDESLIGLSEQLKSLSEDENNSHAGNTTKHSNTNQKSVSNFDWMFPEVAKKINAAGTGYLCDDDEGRDEEFQNG